MRWLARRWTDVAGLLIAAGLGAPSLGYAYGRDQGLFHTVAREWMHGRWPYADVFDIKPPGIYAVYALCVPFGGALWPARLLDLCAVLGTGALAGFIASRRPGSIAVGALAAVGLHYALFDFWHTAQVESWQSLFLMGALACALELEDERRGSVGAGICVAVAVLFKPTALLGGLAPLACLVYAHRSRRAALWFAAGLLAALAVGVLPFAIAGGLADLVFFVRTYARSAAFEVGPGLERFFLDHAVIASAMGAASLAIGAIDRGADPRWRVRAFAAVALFALSLLGVVAQGRFILYHFGALLGPAALAFALALQTGGRLFRTSFEVAGAGVILACTLLWSGPPWVSNPEMTYARFAFEALGREAFVGEAGYDFAELARVAEAIEGLDPDPAHDQLHVRGFEAPLYVLSGLGSPVRMLNETHLAVRGSSRITAWTAEHERRLGAELPRFFVTFVDRPADSEILFDRRYVERYRGERLLLFERPDSRVTPVLAARPRARSAARRCR